MLSKTRKPYMLCLPTVFTTETGNSVIIDYMTDQQLSETYLMINDAAQRGEGFGIDEFVNEELFKKQLLESDCFTITCRESGELLANFILTVSKFYRGSSSVVDPIIIVNPSARGRGFGLLTMVKAVEFSRLLGYQAMYVDTFTNNSAVLHILKRIGGFQQVGFLPVGGRTKNGENVGSLIFYRNLIDEENFT